LSPYEVEAAVNKPLSVGVIEGFFGRPWDWSARQSGIDFLRDYGYHFYIYAPKADPFLRRRWREPMPAETMRQLSELSSLCRKQNIALGIGLTPFEIYLNYDADARMALRSKVLQLNEISANVLCILFDDMRGDVDELPTLQVKVISDVCSWSNAKQFIVCPTYYSYDSRLAREFGSPPKQYLQDLGRMLDLKIDVFWTGENIISDGYSARHIAEVAEQIRRKPFIWDNHISNDSRIRTNHLFVDPASNAWELPADGVAGLAINTMNQAHLSRIALSGYKQLLEDPSEQVRLSNVCRPLAGASFAERLVADRDLFQLKGLEQIDANTRERLLGLYETMKTNPYAQEVSAWLRGEYVFDPQCLTD
jgi:hyaluronoglucosaminidase